MNQEELAIELCKQMNIINSTNNKSMFSRPSIKMLVVALLGLLMSVCVFTQSPGEFYRLCNELLQTKHLYLKYNADRVYFVLSLSVFLVHPTSIAAVDGSTVEFTCTANNSNGIYYTVNGKPASSGFIIDKGFNQLGAEELDTLVTRRNLSVTVSSLYNNTEILCRVLGTQNVVSSNTATLTVQGNTHVHDNQQSLLSLISGPLSSVDGLYYYFIDSSTINISWSPPFTLPGTHITGYNISVTTSNGTTTDYYTSNSYYVLLLTAGITDSPCDQITITVSGYNGLNGEDESISGIYLPSSNVSSRLLLLLIHHQVWLIV